MARNPRPDPKVADHWAARLSLLSTAVERCKHETKVAQQDLHEGVRAAFADGVLVGTMIKATGLSGSRLFQIKFELRD